MLSTNFDLTTIDSAVNWLLQKIGTASVLAFHGDMGAGKTTLITAICRAWQVSDTVGSPTFSIINQYAGTRNGAPEIIYHMDLYRLADEEEAARAGVEDALFSGNTCLVEWPERAPGLFPAETVHLKIEVLDNGGRRLIIDRN
jgi:tRNA threonylcarbamoyladenosine biosynthesis protein TsaE